MWGEPKQATSATTSLVYITLGAITCVWSGIYWYYLQKHDGTDTAYLYVSGFFFTGLVLLVIGLAVGRIGRSARAAEVAAVPTQVVAPVATPVPTATPVVPATATPNVTSHRVPAEQEESLANS